MSAKNRHVTQSSAQQNAPIVSEDAAVENAAENAPEVEVIQEIIAEPIAEPIADSTPVMTAPRTDLAPVTEPASANVGIQIVDVSKTAAIQSAAAASMLVRELDRMPFAVHLQGTDAQKFLQADVALGGNGELAEKSAIKAKFQSAYILMQLRDKEKSLFGPAKQGYTFESIAAYVRARAEWFHDYSPWLTEISYVSRIDTFVTANKLGYVDPVSGEVYNTAQSILIRWNRAGATNWRKAETRQTTDGSVAYPDDVLQTAYITAWYGGDVKGKDGKVVSFSAVPWDKPSQLETRLTDIADMLYPAPKSEPAVTDTHGNPIMSNTPNPSPNPQTDAATNTTTSTTSSEPTSTTNTPSVIRSMGGKVTFRTPETGTPQWDSEIDPVAVQNADPVALPAVAQSLDHAARTYAELVTFQTKLKDAVTAKFELLKDAGCADEIRLNLASMKPYMGKTGFYGFLVETYGAKEVTPPVA